MDQLHVESGQNGLSRRKFLAVTARLSIGAALLPTLAACAPSASEYDDETRRIWEQAFGNESGLNSGMLEMVRYSTLAPSGHNTQPWSAYPQLLMRFGYSQAMPRSLRRPIQDVMT